MKYLAILFVLFLFIMPSTAQPDIVLVDCDLATEIIDDYGQSQVLSQAGIFKTFSEALDPLIGGCFAESDNSGDIESIELESEYVESFSDAEKHDMKNGCTVAYVMLDNDPPLIATTLLGENTMRKVRSHDLYDSNMKPLTAIQEEETQMNGQNVFIAAYLNPKHQERYTLQYEYEGELSEVTFEYERGITGKRNTAGTIVIEC